MLPEQQQRIMGYFIEEAKDHLNTIEQGLLSLQATIEDSEKANEVFRAAHSVKGGAAMLGLDSIQTIAHRMEDYFKILKESSVQVDSTLETMFLRVSDGLKDLLEQLEGPFGLTPEKAQEIMADVDPVFGQLQQHLESLVASGSGVKNSTTARSKAANADALQVAFKQDVSALLRQLLSTFKQTDTTESRRTLQNICAELNSIGQQFELSAWCDLIETARLAAEEPSNEYRVLAPVLIKEIKKSQDLVLAGRASEVGVSDAMQALLPEGILSTIGTLEEETVEENAIADKKSTDDDDFFADGLFDAEIDTDTEDLDELFGLNTDDSAGLLDLQTVDSELPSANAPEIAGISDEWESTQSNLTLEPSQFSDLDSAIAAEDFLKEELIQEDSVEKDSVEEPASRLDIDLDFIEIPSELSALIRNTDVEEKADESLDALPATVNVTGPDVGAEELNSLADLFDGDLEELDNTLGGHPFVSEEMRLHPERIDLTEEDDLTDLLADDNLTPSDSAEKESTGSEEIDDDLFGGTLTEGGFADVVELNLDEEIDIAEEISDTSSKNDNENSLDSDLAALSEDPWNEEEGEENDLENLFGSGAESLVDQVESAVSKPAANKTSETIETDGLSDELEDELFGENAFGEETPKDDSLDNRDFEQTHPEIEEKDTATLVQATVIGEELTPSPGNLSSGLFAVEPVSPSEEEIEFPTLTGVKLEEAEKDIDSFFFDSLTDEPSDNSTEDDSSAQDNSLQDSEENPSVAAAAQLSEDPWGELDADDELLPTNKTTEETTSESQLSEFDLTELEPAELELENIEMESSDLEGIDLERVAPESIALNEPKPSEAESVKNQDSDADFIDFDLLSTENESGNDVAAEEGLTNDLFDLESSLAFDIDLEKQPEGASVAEENTTDSLWDDLSLSSETTTEANVQKQPAKAVEAIASEIAETDDTADVDTIFSAEYVTESDIESNFSLEDEIEEPDDNDALLDDFLMATPASETTVQDPFEATSNEAETEDFSEIEDLFSEDNNSTKSHLEYTDSQAGSILQDSLSNNFLTDESIELLSTEHSHPTEESVAISEVAVSEDDFPTLDGLPGDVAPDILVDDTISSLGSTEEEDSTSESEGNTSSDDFLLDFENLGAELETDKLEINLDKVALSTEEGLEQQTQAEEETTGDETLDFDDLESLLSDDDNSDQENSDQTDTKVDGERTSPSTESRPVESTQENEDEEDFDDLERLLEDGDSTSVSPPVATRRAAPRTPRRNNPTREQNMRVPVKHLDNLSNLVGELVVNRNTLERDQERLRQFLDNLLFQVQQLNDVGQRMRDLYERSLLESSLVSNRKAYAAGNSQKAANEPENHATGATFDALEMDRFTGFHTLSQEMIELIVRVRESSSDIGYTVESSDQVTRQFRQVTTQLQEGLNTARMVAFSQAADRLPRAVRDISLKCGKEARLIVEGKDTLIDKMIVEHLYDPLTHLVNNAITHGIETPEERTAAGKPPEGSITVQAFYQGNQTVIYVADDGGGINPAFVKRKAVEKKLLTQAEADQLSDIETYELLFHAGFSTRDQADDFAGRGVGMDVVRTSLAEIRGVITIDSEQGKGTSFTIRLPLTLSISKALSCVSNQARIAFPMDGVEDMLDVPRDRVIKNEEGQDCVKWRDRTLPFQGVTDLLKFNRTLGRGRVYGGSQDDDVLSIIVLRSANTFVAIQVDQVIGEEEIVIKQLEGPVPKPLGIAGATILGDGRVMPIADVLELIDIAMGRVRREPSSLLWAETAEAEEEEITAKTDPTVLIVDDSITVRELLSMSFNKVGYRVEQARDGQEAWDKLRSGLPCDLVFCDIEMPRMDGLELLSRMQKDNHLKSVPIAMLTSRGADRHRQMAVDLGASGYCTRPYLEGARLDAAQRMLNGETLAKGRGG